MTENDAERAIAAFTEERTPERFEAMYRTLLSAVLVVPISDEGVQSSENIHRLPVRCFRTDEGYSAVPAFTRVERLFDWRPEGSHYVDLSGDKIVDMAFGMAEIDVVAINPKGVPRGLIPRQDFLEMLAMHHGLEVDEPRSAASGNENRRKKVVTTLLLVGVVAVTCLAIMYVAK